MMAAKRKYSDMEKSEPSPSVNQTELRNVIDELVTFYERLDTRDELNQKPNFSYTELIFFAIMRSPNFCLPISEIYRYMESRFAFFRNSTRKHWRNAVRHSLSKTKCFTKLGVEYRNNRRGIVNRSSFLWTVVPSSLLAFTRGDYRPGQRKIGSNPLRTRFHHFSAIGVWDQCVLVYTSRMETLRHTLNSSPNPAKFFLLQTCNIPEQTSTSTGDSPLPKRHKMVTPSSPDVECIPAIAYFPSSSPDTGIISRAFHEATCSSSPYDSGFDTSGELSSSTASDYFSRDADYRLPEVSLDTICNIPLLPYVAPLQLQFDDVTDQVDTYIPDLPYFVGQTMFNTPCYTDCAFSSPYSGYLSTFMNR